MGQLAGSDWRLARGIGLLVAVILVCFMAMLALTERAAHQLTSSPGSSSSWEHKLRQRLWNGAGGVYDAFLIDVHLKKREECFNSIMHWPLPPHLTNNSCSPTSTTTSAAMATATATANATATATAGHKRRSQRFWAKLALCVQIWIVEMLGIKMKIALNNCWGLRITRMRSLANILNDAARQEISAGSSAWQLWLCLQLWLLLLGPGPPRFDARPRWFMPVGNYVSSTLVANGLLTQTNSWPLTNARPIVAHPLTVDRSAVGGTSTYSLIHQNGSPACPPFPSHPQPARFICDAESHSPLNRW